MGAGTFDSSAWSEFTSTRAATPLREILKSSRCDEAFNPLNFVIRESRDSADNPISTPILFGADVTGSMDKVSDALIRSGIGMIYQGVQKIPALKGPQLCIAAYGDVEAFDEAPIQMTQFESDNRIVEQMERIWLEGGGGPNGHESDDLVYYMAAYRTSHDHFEKRGKKGYLFTCGDEPPPNVLTRDQIKRATGDNVQADMPIADLILAASRTWNVYHIIVQQGNCVRYHGIDAVKKPWVELLGQNVVVIEDITKIGEVVSSIIAVNEGESVEDVVKSWGGGTEVVVRNAISGLEVKKDVGTGVATL